MEMTLSDERRESLPPVRSARSPILNSTSHNRRSSIAEDQLDGLEHHYARGSGVDPPNTRHPSKHNHGRAHALEDERDRDLDTENATLDSPCHLHTRKPDVPRRSSNNSNNWEHNSRQAGAWEGGDESPQAAARRLRRISAVDRGLIGVGGSLRSSWSTPVLPAIPNGEAVPALLSHLAELRSVCKRQRDSGRSIRSALVRKQSELDQTSAEAAWLRAELGFIVGDMLGTLQQNPTVGTVFSSLSERIRCDLGAEEAAVYIDVGDGTLWMVPSRRDEEGETAGEGDEAEVFIQKGVGVVGLVAMGAVPDAATLTSGDGRAGVDGDGVDVLLLNDGLEAFDNGTTVEATLLRLARRRRSRGSNDSRGAVGTVSAMAGTVKNMLLARVGTGAGSQVRGLSFLSARDSEYSHLPEPPTAVIQALNKQVAPERFTEGDARAVRTLAPAVVAGARLILSLLSLSSECRAAASGDGGREQVASLCRRVREGRHGAEESRLLETLRRARDGIGADRARIYVLGPKNADECELRLWFEEPPNDGTDLTLPVNRYGGGTNLTADGGLHGLALASEKAVRSEDALSDSRYDRELDLREGFLARSVLYAPLSPNLKMYTNQSEYMDSCSTRKCAPLGLLQLAIGRGVCRGGPDGNRRRVELGEDGDGRRKAFVEADEPLAEAFGEQIAGLLADLLKAGFKPRASVTSLAGGAGHVGDKPDAPAWTPNPDVGGDPDQNALGAPEKFSYKDGEVIGTSSPRGRGRNGVLQTPFETNAADPPMSRASWMNGRGGARGDHSAAGVAALRSDAYGGQIRATTAVNRGAADGSGEALASSSASTATSSPLGVGVRASVATISGQTALLQPPSPCTDCSDGVSDGQSPDRLPSQVGRRSPPGSVEAIQARSWASAHRVLEACKEGFAQGGRASLESQDHTRHYSHHDFEEERSPSPHHISDARPKNTESMAAAVCSLVSSLLPDCSAVLLLLNAGSGRLQVAGCCPAATKGLVDDHHLPPRIQQPVRREDVARRALTSGKALLAQASEEEPRRNRMTDTLGRGRGYGSNADGERVFCIPVRGCAGATFGVLQVFLPVPPLPIYSPVSSPGDVEKLSASPASPRAAVSAPTPPPSFFMATKIITDCLGLTLGWSEALDRTEADHEAEAKDSAATAAASNKARDCSQRELEAKHKRGMREVEQTHAFRVAEAADSHASAIASLLEDKETLCVAAAKALSRARSKRDAARALSAWRETSKRLHRADKNVELMHLRRRMRSFRDWWHHARMAKKARAKEKEACSWGSKRRIRRTFGSWTKAAAKERCVKERHMTRARIITKVFMRHGPMRRLFSRWRAALHSASAEQQVMALKRAQKVVEEKAYEEVSRVEARAQHLADRVAELSRRRRQDCASRAALRLWSGHTRQLGRQRESSATSIEWRRRRLIASALSMWRRLALPCGELTTSEHLKKTNQDSHLASQNNCRKDIARARREAAACRPFEHAGAETMDASPQRLTGTAALEDPPGTPTHTSSMVAAPLDGKHQGTRRSERALEEKLQRRAETAAVAFRRQRERLSTLQTLAAWRGAAAAERSKREALFRLVRSHHRSVISSGFERWRARVHAVRAAAEAITSARTMGEEAARRWWREQGGMNRSRKMMTSPRRVGALRSSETAPTGATEVAAGAAETVETLVCQYLFQHGRGTMSKMRGDEGAAESFLVAGAAAAAAAKAAVKTAAEEMETEAAKVNQGRAHDRYTITGLQEEVKALHTELATATEARLAEAAAVVKSAAVEATLVREQEVQCGRDSLVQLKNTVETLQAETTASALRQETADAQLLERSARVSGLTLSLAQAFRRGRERVGAVRALAAMRDAVRSRHLASTTTARIAAIRCTRYLRYWRAAAEESKRRSAASSSATAFAEDYAARTARDGAYRVLQGWAESCRTRRRALGAAKTLCRARQRAALRTWTKRCWQWKAAAANHSKFAAHLVQSRLRRGLRSWFRLTFGDGRGGNCASDGEENDIVRGTAGESRVLARLVGVAARVEQANNRGRARTVLRKWSEQAKEAQRRAQIESQTGEAFVDGNLAVALLRWRAVTLARRRVKQGLDRGISWASLHGVSTGWSTWREKVELAKRKSALRDATAVAAIEQPVSSDPSMSGPDASDPDAATTGIPNTPEQASNASQRCDVPAAPTSSSPDVISTLDGNAVGAGNRPGLLDLLVDVCAAPPPYPLGSGVRELGNDACRAAVRAFDLLSASLFEVVGSPEAAAVRVASVKQTRREDDPQGGREDSLVDSAVADGGVPEREPLGEGTVGVAAQSARPVCVEVFCTASTTEVSSDESGSVPPLAITPSTVLCVPVMLQSASIANSQVEPSGGAGFYGSGGDCNRKRGPHHSPSVEVVGVLRAVRAGTGGFAGDDARALSAFCGQLALAMVAERVIKDSRAVVEAHAAKEARAVRRHACRRIGALSAEGAVARALLRRPSQGTRNETSVDPRQMREVEELWRSVAGLAAGALDCERIDLLRVAPLAGDRESGGSVPYPAFLSQLTPSSRSFRRRSREALLAAKASSRSVLSSLNSVGGVDGDGEMVSSWLCMPVPGACDDVRRREEGGGAVTVCCAVNKRSGKKFDDVDEALLSTIAALYAVAASWLSPAAHSHHSSGDTSPKEDSEHVALPPPANNGNDSHNLDSSARDRLFGATNEPCARPSTVASEEANTHPINAPSRSGGTPLCDAATSPVATVEVPPKDGHGRAVVQAFGVMHSESRIYVGSRDIDTGECRDRQVLFPTSDLYSGAANVAATGRERKKGRGGGSSQGATSYPGAQRSRGYSRPAPRPLEEEGDRSVCRPTDIGRVAASTRDIAREGERNGVAPLELPHVAAKETIELRERAERAERMLRTTRERLRRALEDGVNAAAAAATLDATEADVDTTPTIDRAENSNGVVEDETAPTSDVEKCQVRHRRGRSACRLVPGTAGTRVKFSSRHGVRSGSRRKEREGAPPSVTCSSSSCAREGHRRRCCSDDDEDGRLRRQTGGQEDSEPGKLLGHNARLRRRRHSFASDESSNAIDNVENGSRRKGGKDEEGGDARPGGKRERRRRVELRASDLVRMREVIARLRVTTAQLQAERASGSCDCCEEQRLPARAEASADHLSIARQPSAEDAQAGAAGGNAKELAQENANLRRKLCGLVALEELEGRAMNRGLLPLTGEGVSGGEFFPSETHD